jgi:hypothetical protein
MIINAFPSQDVEFRQTRTKSQFIGTSFDHHEFSMTIKPQGRPIVAHPYTDIADGQCPSLRLNSGIKKIIIVANPL